MIKIQDILDFIGSKRPQYKMENWKDLKTDYLRYVPSKDENGNLGYYNDNNNKQDYWASYFKYDDLNEKGHMEDGEKTGIWEQYVDNELFSKGYMINGVKNGEWEEYLNGQLFRKGNFKNGNRDGEWGLYLNGRLHKIEVYKNNNIVGYKYVN